MMAKIKISYQLDSRIRVALVSTGTVKFLMDLDKFYLIVGRPEDGEHKGSILIPSSQYLQLREEGNQYAKA